MWHKIKNGIKANTYTNFYLFNPLTTTVGLPLWVQPLCIVGTAIKHPRPKAAVSGCSHEGVTNAAYTHSIVHYLSFQKSHWLHLQLVALWSYKATKFHFFACDALQANCHSFCQNNYLYATNRPLNVTIHAIKQQLGEYMGYNKYSKRWLVNKTQLQYCQLRWPDVDHMDVT